MHANVITRSLFHTYTHTHTHKRNLAVTDCGRTGGNCPNCAAQVNKSLTKAQEQQCYSDDDGHRRINAIAQGTQDAVIDCQLRYKNNKWNCSTFFSQDLFGKFVVEGQ